MRKFIIFLIRLRFGLKTREKFRFTNQKSKDIYYFSSKGFLLKYNPTWPFSIESKVSLNWLMSDECKIEKIKN